MGKSDIDTIENIFYEILKAIGFVFTCVFTGLGELKKKNPLIAFIITLLITVILLLNKNLFNADYQKYVVYSAALPIAALFTIGMSRKLKQQDYKKAFEEAAFKGRDGRTPLYIDFKRKNGQDTTIFSSNIPLVEWEKALPQLETSLNCNILFVEQGSSKRIVKLVSTCSDVVIPTKIDWQDEFAIKKEDNEAVLVIGENGIEKIIIDLKKTPHVLAAGETNSGKSVLLRLMLWQMAKQGAVLFMFDFKGGVEFGYAYEEYGEVVTEREAAVKLLELLVEENTRRLALFREMRVKNLVEYNKKADEKLSRICVFFDEIGEMMDSKGATKEDKTLIEQATKYISTLARQGRSPAINLFFGTQRPDANILPGQIKNNVPVRMCSKLADRSASEIVLGNTSATQLPAIKGRFMFKIDGTIQFQAYYFDDETMLGTVDVSGHRVLTPELGRYLTKKAQNSKPTSHIKKQGQPRPVTQYDDCWDDGITGNKVVKKEGDSIGTKQGIKKAPGKTGKAGTKTGTKKAG